MSAPFIVLGEYKPKKWSAIQIGFYITGLTYKLGLLPHLDPKHGPLVLRGRNWSSKALHAEVRRRTFKTQMAEGWHYDGDTTPGSKPDCGLVLWASNTPTEIKWREVVGNAVPEFYQPEPYQIVLFHNLSCLHRRPPDCHRVRWIFRQRVHLTNEWRKKLGV